MKVRAAQVFMSVAKGMAPVVNRALAMSVKRTKLSGPIDRARWTRAIPRGDVLEIGAYHSPVIEGDGVAYFDVFDTPTLRERAAALDVDVDVTRIPEMDFVSPVGDLGIIDRTFDTVVSSHLIEHQPDLIRHLEQVSTLLKPGGGYYLVIPDKRYCFDHFSPLTVLTDVIKAHEERRWMHTPQSIEKYRLGTTHNLAMMHWVGVHGAKRDSPTTREVAAQEIEQARQGIYIDVHAWMFTPASFLEIASALKAAGSSDFDVESVHATGFGQLEFFAVLRKAG